MARRSGEVTTWPMSAVFIAGAAALILVALILFGFLGGSFGKRFSDRFVDIFFSVSLPVAPIFLKRGKKKRKGQVDDEAVLTVTIIIGALFALIALLYLGFVNDGFAKAGSIIKQRFERTGGFFGT